VTGSAAEDEEDEEEDDEDEDGSASGERGRAFSTSIVAEDTATRRDIKIWWARTLARERTQTRDVALKDKEVGDALSERPQDGKAEC
jgi:hypothetical protein